MIWLLIALALFFGGPGEACAPLPGHRYCEAP